SRRRRSWYPGPQTWVDLLRRSLVFRPAGVLTPPRPVAIMGMSLAAEKPRSPLLLRRRRRSISTSSAGLQTFGAAATPRAVSWVHFGGPQREGGERRRRTHACGTLPPPARRRLWCRSAPPSAGSALLLPTLLR